MTYYEELGVTPHAGASEIHQAYRVLARLVHPDGQADEQVRGMAERQMKRLNDILATLLDASRRRAYDDSLTALAGAPAVDAAAKHRPPVARFQARPQPRRSRAPDWVHAALLNWFWIVPAAVMLGVGGWYVAGAGRQTPPSDHPHPVTQSAPGAPGQPTRRAPREVPHPRVAAARARAHQTEPPAARAIAPAAPPAPDRPELSTAVAAARAAPSPPDRPDLSAAVVSASAAPPSFAAPSPPEKPEPSAVVASARSAAPSSLAGAWLYVPEREDASAPGTYPPTYVEFLLTEEHGELSGSYRARYRIPDRAMSPEVLFRAQGKSPDGESARLGWTSADGARGEVEVRLHGPNAMSVTWWTTGFGRHPALASGSA